MIYPEKTVKLKNGGEAIFRAPRAEDAAEMRDYLIAVCGETDFLANYPDERESLTVEGEASYLLYNRESPCEMMIVAEVGGKIAGNCQVVFDLRHERKKHRAEVMIALLREFWGMGIGRKLFEEMEAVALAQGAEYLELTVVEGNERAMGLYRKMGFEAVATLPDAMRYRDGTSRAEITMRKKIGK